MAKLTTRSLTTSTVSSDTFNKGSALTIAEMDSNFLNLNTGKLDNVTDDFTGVLSIKGSGDSATGSQRFYDNDDSNYVQLQSPATLSANYTLTLPTTDGDADQLLQTDGSGNLTWATVSGASGDITGVTAGAGMTGGGASGDVTLNVIAGTGITANADEIVIDTAITVDKTTAQTLTNKTLTSAILNTGVSGTAILDEDAMGTNSDTQLATQQSIKAYADTKLANLVEDTTPQLGGTLDILAQDIKSSSANVVISADANDKDILFNIKDTGGTLNEAAHYNTVSQKHNTTPGDDSTEVDLYTPIVDMPQGLRIGSKAFNFSSNGQPPDNNSSDYSTCGILVTNDDTDQWPTVDVISYGGANPLLDKNGHIWFNGAQEYTDVSGTGGDGSSATFDIKRNGLVFEKTDGSGGSGDGINTAGSGYSAGNTITIAGDDLGGIDPDNNVTVTVDTVDGSGGITAISIAGLAPGSLATHFPNGTFNMRAANGTQASPARLRSGDVIGKVQWNGYDGTDFGGTASISSITMAVTANENFTSSNARGAKLIIDATPTGGSASDGDATSDRRHQITVTGDTVQIGNENKDDSYATMDSSNGIFSLTNAVMQLDTQSADPTSNLAEGQMYFNSTDKKFYGYNGTSWVVIGTQS